MNMLRRLYYQDKQDHNRKKWIQATKKEIAKVEIREKERKRKVLSLYKKEGIKSATDYHYAALIFQHGSSPDDYKTAHQFAKKAVKLGNSSACWLMAATLDRWLLSTGKAQKYGTQFRKDKNGKWQLALPVDKNTTDEERARYGVPALSQAIEKFKQRYGLAELLVI